MLDKIKQQAFSGAIVFDKIEDALTFMGCKPNMSPEAQAARAAWQDEAAMSHSERMAALKARRAKAGAA